MCYLQSVLVLIARQCLYCSEREVEEEKVLFNSVWLWSDLFSISLSCWDFGHAHTRLECFSSRGGWDLNHGQSCGVLVSLTTRPLGRRELIFACSFLPFNPYDDAGRSRDSQNIVRTSLKYSFLFLRPSINLIAQVVGLIQIIRQGFKTKLLKCFRNWDIQLPTICLKLYL